MERRTERVRSRGRGLTQGLVVGLLVACAPAACSTPGATGTPPASEDGAAGSAAPGRGRVIGRVGNRASGLADIPDWDKAAQRLVAKMEGRFPQTLPEPAAACAKMLDAARDHYISADGIGSRAVETMAATRQADLARCIAETEPKVAWCVATLVAEENGEYPWLVDQCGRAFGTRPPPGPEAAGLNAAGPAPANAARVSTAVPRAPSLEMTFVGDVIFGRYRPSGYDSIPEGDHEVFGPMHEALASDLLVGNLETPLVRTLPTDSPIGSRFRFGASLEQASNLVRGGFSVMSLANNHYYDMRAEGLEQTPVLLRELGIVPIGAARAEAPLFRIETVERNGWKLAFVAVSARRNAPKREGVPELPFLSTRAMDETLSPLVRAAAGTHDLVIVVVHWGNEYADDPDFIQVKAAHALVDAGADLVIGHHPHVLQGVEAYERGLIAYSLGNFLFENTTDPPRLTGVLRVRFTAEDCFDRVVFHPAYIKRRPVQHPVPATGFMGSKVKARVVALGKRRGVQWTEQGDDLVLQQVSCAPGPTPQ